MQHIYSHIHLLCLFLCTSGWSSVMMRLCFTPLRKTIASLALGWVSRRSLLDIYDAQPVISSITMRTTGGNMASR